MRSKIALLIALVLILGLSAFIRISLPYNQVIDKTGEVRLTTVDAYAHLRMADWEYEHFPETMKWDSYLSYPDGSSAASRPLWSWTIALIAKTLNTTVDLVAAWLPAILGVLIALWVFIIGYFMFGAWAGIIAALFVAVIPGELIGRTGLGCADHDASEITLLLLVIMFIVLSMKKKWYFAFGAGLFLGLYNLNWTGAPLLTIILCLYFVVQTIIDKCRNRLDYKVHAIFLITMALGLVVYLGTESMRILNRDYVMFYSAAVALPILTGWVLFLLRKAKPIYYILTWATMIASSIFILVIVVPQFGHNVFLGFSAFFPQLSGFGTTISEMMPLFWSRGQVDFITPWAYYGLCLYSGVIGMIYFLYKNWREPICLLMGMWSILTIILVLIQRRYGMYAAISMSLYSGYLCWIILKGISVKRLNRADRKRGKKEFNVGYAVMTALVLIMFLFVPNYVGATRVSVQLPYVPSDAWMDGMKWLRTNSPQVNETKPEYSVLSWWDYGYWIAREAKRPVIIFPGGGNILGMSKYLLSTTTDESLKVPMPNGTDKIMTAKETRDYYKIKYIVIDYQMVTGKLYAIPEGAGYTPKNMGDTLIMKLWNTGKSQGYEKVWESTQKYSKDAQVKIFGWKE
jgi:asparagine N-glycosylation enzyme membrane subunit Stt3